MAINIPSVDESKVRRADIYDLIDRSLRTQGNRRLTREQKNALINAHPELKKRMFKDIRLGIEERRGGEVSRYTFKKFYEILGKRVRESQKRQAAVKQSLRKAEKLKEESRMLVERARGKGAVEALEAVKRAKALEQEAAQLEQSAEEAPIPVKTTVRGRRSFKAPKATVKKLIEAKIADARAAAGPTKAELEEQERIARTRRRLQRYERTKELREQITKRLFGASQARSSSLDTKVVDFHKGAKTSATDYHALPTSISDLAQKHEPMSSASELREEHPHYNPQRRAGKDDQETEDPLTAPEGGGAEEDLDDNLPLVA